MGDRAHLRKEGSKRDGKESTKTTRLKEEGERRQEREKRGREKGGHRDCLILALPSHSSPLLPLSHSPSHAPALTYTDHTGAPAIERARLVNVGGVLGCVREGFEQVHLRQRLPYMVQGLGVRVSGCILVQVGGLPRRS